MMSKITSHILAVVMLTTLITYLHFGVMRQFSPAVILEELYYLPLLLGAFRFGVKGTILTWLLVSAAYLPFFFGTWTTTYSQLLDRILHIVFTTVFAFVACFLAVRERKRQKQAERERYLAGIGQVATVIVHDLKNPLISILGFVRRLREGKGDVIQAAQTIEGSAQDMQRIVNSVLDFAKPLQLDMLACDVRETIRQAVNSCQAKADALGVAVVLHLPPEPVSIAIDGFQVVRALVNLIDNAIEASHRGGKVTITVTVEYAELMIIIKDSGTGMNKEMLDHLFEPFYTTKSGGTGLGMPIAKKIFEEHGGSLQISSKLESGTEATARLPSSVLSKGETIPLWKE
jgi:signal transduction histidine kinase